MLKQCPECPKHIEEKFLHMHIFYKHTDEGQEFCKKNGVKGRQIQMNKALDIFHEPVRYKFNDMFDRQYPVKKGHRYSKLW